MGAVAEAVVESVSDAVEAVGDAVSDIGREVGQAAEKVGREVGKAAEVVGQTIAENPIQAVAIVAIAVAAPYALPAATAALGTTMGAIAVGAASGAIVGAAGALDRGSSILEPTLKGALIGGATAGLAPQLTSGLSSLGVPASVATTVGSGLAGAAGGAGAAALSGGDVGLGALSGGLGSAVGAGTQLGTGSRLVGTLAGTTTAGLVGGLEGREAAGRAILAGLQGVIASNINQQFAPKLQETQQKYSALQESTRNQFNAARDEYDSVYTQAENLQADQEQTRQRLLAIQQMTNPTDAEVAEFDSLYNKFQNQQTQIAEYNNRLSTIAANVNNLQNQYASLAPAYDNEVETIQAEAKQQFAGLQKQAGLLADLAADEDPVTQALVKEYLSAQAGGLPKGIAQYASAQGTTDVPLEPSNVNIYGIADIPDDSITVDDPLYGGNKLNLQQAMLRGEALDTMYKEALQQNNATKLQLLDQARIENSKVITTLWNTVVGQGDTGQYAAMLGTPSAGGQTAGGSLSDSGGIMSVDLPFVPIAYVYNKAKPEQVNVMGNNGVTYSLVNVDGRNLLQDNSSNQYVVELTPQQVDSIKSESNASIEQSKSKQTETETKTAPKNAGGGGETGATGAEKEKTSNILDDIVRIESQISAARSSPVSSFVSPDISVREAGGKSLGTSEAVGVGKSAFEPGGGNILGDIFSQGFGTTAFGTGTGTSGGGDETGKGKGTGGGKGTGRGTGEGSGEGESKGGVSSLYVGGVSKPDSTVGGGGVGRSGAGGVLYPSVGTQALSQALNIIPGVAGGGGDVDPSRSLNKKQNVWNVESLKLKDALGA